MIQTSDLLTSLACFLLPYYTDCIDTRNLEIFNPFYFPLKGMFNHKPATLLYLLHTEEIEAVNSTAAQTP